MIIIIMVSIIFICIIVFYILNHRFYLKNIKRNNDIHQSVPLIIHQVVKNKRIDRNLYRLIHLNQKRNPECSFMYYDDSDIHALIRQNFDQKVYKAFCRINPLFGPCLADFARYCILYLYGGIYMDIKSEMKKNIKPLIRSMSSDHDLMVYYWPIHYDARIMSHNYIAKYKHIFQNDYEIMNWVIISTPKNELLRDLINVMSDNILQGHNGRGKSFVLSLTGPRFFTSILLKHNLRGVMINEEIPKYFEYDSKVCGGSCRNVYYINQTDYTRLHYEKVLR